MSRFQHVFDYLDDKKPETVLEVGTWNGTMAERLLKFGVKRYIGFDVFDDADEDLDQLENNAKKRVTKASVEERLKDYADQIELVQGNTRDTLPAYVEGKDPFVDMVIIDGGHSKGTIRSDLLAVLRIVRHGGAIFLDDYYFDCPIPMVGAQSALAEINIPYTVLPRADRATAVPPHPSYAIKMARIDMVDVPRVDLWSVPDERAWKFEAA